MGETCSAAVFALPVVCPQWIHSGYHWHQYQSRLWSEEHPWELECRRAQTYQASCCLCLSDPRSLSFIHLDQYTRLVVIVSGEDLLFLRGNGSVPGNQHSHNTANSFQPKGERGNIKQQKVLNLIITLTTQNGSLDGSTIGNSLIRVDAFAKFLPIKNPDANTLDYVRPIMFPDPSHHYHLPLEVHQPATCKRAGHWDKTPDQQTMGRSTWEIIHY